MRAPGLAWRGTDAVRANWIIWHQYIRVGEQTRDSGCTVRENLGARVRNKHPGSVRMRHRSTYSDRLFVRDLCQYAAKNALFINGFCEVFALRLILAVGFVSVRSLKGV